MSFSSSPSRIIGLILAVFWGVIIVLASLTPGKHLPHYKFLSSDKAVHFMAYFIWTIFLLMALGRRRSTATGLFLTAAAVISFGYAIELIQGYCIKGRYYDFLDILANSTGSLAGIFFMKIFFFRKPFSMH